MPKILERLVSQLQAKGKSRSSAYAIATSSLQRAGDLKPGTQEATSKGARRGNMTPGARAKTRAVKAGGGKTSDYTYNSSTNRTKKK
jgi:hypothetical protein